MRVTCVVLLFLINLSTRGQETHFTSTPIKLGIELRDTTNQLVSLAPYCQGFDEQNLPVDLIVPANFKISVFIPGSSIDSEESFWWLSANRYVSIVYANEGENSEGGERTWIQNDEVVHQGQNVVTILNRKLFSNQKIDYTFARLNIAKDGSNVFSDTTNIKLEGDAHPVEVTEVFVLSEMIDYFSHGVKQVQYEPIGHSSTSYFRHYAGSRFSYGEWVDKGYISTTDTLEVPKNPVFPYNENNIYIRLNRSKWMTDVKLERNGVATDITQSDYTRDGMIQLKDLKGGSYKLLMSDTSAHYSRPPTVYSFKIKSSFWHEGGYWVAILLPLFLIFFMVYRTYSNAKLQRVELTKKLTEAELTAIRSQLNPHFLFNSLNAIQNLVNKAENARANDYIVKLSRLMRLVLNRSSESFHSLKHELEIAETYLELESLRSQFRYEIEVGEEVDMNMLIPTMLLQPYLENAVIHGVLSKGADLVQLNISVKEDACLIAIRDNGKGESSKKGNGKGMAMSSERLEVIERRHGIKTAVQARTTSTGYEVIIQIPTDL